MSEYEIKQIGIEEYSKCNNIWNMKKCPFTNKFKKQIVDGDRIVYIYKINHEFIGEGDLVMNVDDSDYYVPNQRIYVSRMIVKKEYRNQGIGGIILDYLIEQARGWVIVKWHLALMLIMTTQFICTEKRLYYTDKRK